MLNGLFSSSTVPMLEQVVNFAQSRHGVLAGNIANLDTPGYKTRDLSPEEFQSRLRSAIETSRRPAMFQSPGGSSQSENFGPGLGLSPGGIQHVYSKTAPSKIQQNAFDDVSKSITSLLYHDGSDVSLEKQITEISKNHSQHNLAINLMSAQFRQIEAAISERVV